MTPRAAWRLIVDRPEDGFFNMAVDELLLGLAGAASCGGVLRLYRWQRPTLSIGLLQPLRRVADLDFCRRRGVDVVRRPTGGRAVLHYEEITYSVTARAEAFPGAGTVLETYRVLSGALCRGLNRAGIPAEVSRPPLPGREGADTPAAAGPRAAHPCFASLSRHEITCRGKKLLGSSQRRLTDRFLQHGSLPVEPHWDLLLQAIGHPPGAAAPARAYTSLREAAGVGMERAEEVMRALATGFAEGMGVPLEERPLLAGERAAAERLRAFQYLTCRWNLSR